MTELHAPPPAADAYRPIWQRELAAAVRDPETLIERLDLDPGLLPAARRAAALFPLRVPRGYVARMARGDPDDALLRQVLPLDAELVDTPGYHIDAVGDLGALHPGGVIHKYHGRALLVATGACAIHCRYCFRRHFPYAGANAATDAWTGALDYLKTRPEIREVILSGGDPLTLSDRRLAQLVVQLAAIPHVKTLRVHTRLPVVLPERIDAALLDWLTGTRLRRVVVLHANHANELDASVAVAAKRLTRAGAVLLNQAVLMRGVNDTTPALADLSERLFDCGVVPYYLHQLDRVQGAAHFEVAAPRALALMRELAARMPGYLVPRLVREIPGQPAKTWLA